MSQEQRLAATGTGGMLARDVSDRGDGQSSVRRPPTSIEEAIDRARTRIAPLWPLQAFVAVNPFLSLSGKPFTEACDTMKRVAGADMLMPRGYYLEQIESGRINDDDLRAALLEIEGPSALEGTNLSSWKLAIGLEPVYRGDAASTVAGVLDQMHGTRWEAEVTEQISKWSSAYWDEGQAAWRMPWRGRSFYTAWRAASEVDRAPEVLGLKGFRQRVGALPEDPIATIRTVVSALGVEAEALDSYFFRALFSIRGWAAYARYRGWSDELDGKKSDMVLELLAVRLAWDFALLRLHDGAELQAAWSEAVVEMAEKSKASRDPEVIVDTVLQTAFDKSFQRTLLGKLGSVTRQANTARIMRPLQAAFCIDVRSEVYRRALEKVAPEAQTIGFAGFFGFPIEYVPIGQHNGSAQCPVLLKPKFVVQEKVNGAEDDEQTEILGLRLLRRRAAKAWKSFKSSAVSSFVYVETAGLTFAPKLASDALGLTRPVKHPTEDGLDANVLPRKGPSIEPSELDARSTGFAPDARVDIAEGVLKAMSLRSGFARLVMLAGHGSTTVNNPHASGLDCGACGGSSGEPNARVAAMILNDSDVRKGLSERGIRIPSQTWFLGCLHDTTTDEVTIFDRDQIPETHTDDISELERWLGEASKLARAERSSSLGIDNPSSADQAIFRRSRDWSQPRPEWGLAGNAAFIAAPRTRTRGVNLEGRSFLHDYDWCQDEDFSVLELIMTAPMVVASWINLQYYGSAVNGDAFGCGNKVLHNVVGTIGVLQGNGGDLQTGLSLQSVHDGTRYVHEPLRLNVFIEAPTNQIEAVMAKHPGVGELVDNGWINLLAIVEDGSQHLRYIPNEGWTPAA